MDYCYLLMQLKVHGIVFDLVSTYQQLHTPRYMNRQDIATPSFHALSNHIRNPLRP